MRWAELARGMAAGALLLVAGCTWEPGEHFAVVSARIGAVYVPRADRELPAGWQKLASGYEIRLGQAQLKVLGVHLLAGPTGQAGFDPANPPAGYSLCHNGHCHAADGRLVSYEDIAAALTGGAAPAPSLSLAGTELNLLAPPALQPLPCPAPCALPRGEVNKLRIDVAAVILTGEVRAGPGRSLPQPTLEFAAGLTAAPGQALTSVATALDLAADNRHPPQVTLDIGLTTGAELFDEIEWSGLTLSQGKLLLSGEGPAPTAARQALTEKLAAMAVGGRVQRADP